jgi:hypothetical protein
VVGDANVGCEAPVSGCRPAHPALRGWLDRRTLPIPFNARLRDRYTPIWLDGAPALPPPQAVLLDRTAARRNLAYSYLHDEPLPEAGAAAFVIWRPGSVELASVATCEAWEVRTAPAGAVVVDRASGTWSWVEIFDADPDATAGHRWRCAGEAIVRGGGVGEDSSTAQFVDPRAGRVAELRLGWTSVEGLTLADDERVGSWGQTVAQVRAQIAMPEADLLAADGPCADLTDAPLLDNPAGPPCTSSGQADVDGQDPLDCWTVERFGTRAAGNVYWNASVAPGCGDRTWSISLTINDVMSVREQPSDLPGTAPRAALAWLARRVVGDAVGCTPARTDCPAPDPAPQHVWTRFAAPWSDHLVWHAGTPAMWGPSALIAEQLFNGDPGATFVVFRPVEWTVARTAGCDRWDLWTGAGGVAVVDRRRDRWTWLYLGGPKMPPYADRPAPSAASCDDRHITVAFADGTEVGYDGKGDPR